MKKTIKHIVMALLCLNFSLASMEAFAQPPDSSDLLGNIHYFYSGIDSNSITTKILLDRTHSDLVFEGYTGSGTIDTADYSDWRQLYLDLYNTKYPSVNMIMLDSIQKIASGYLDQGKFPIAVLNYNYNYMDTMALYNDSVVLDTINKKLVEVGPSASNYLTERVFSICLPRGYTQSSTVSFIFPSSLYFKNVVGTYSFEANFGDGEGFNPIVFDSTYTISYIDTGEFYKLIQIKAINGSSEYFSKTGFIRKAGVDPPNLTLVKADFIDPASSCSLISGYGIGNAKVYIQYADVNNPVITKPFIFVEGFDYDNNQNDDRYGDVSWVTFAAGRTPDEMTGEDVYPQLALLPNLMAELKNKGYDVLVLDFQDATTYIQRNTNTLIKLIQWVNANKVGTEENIIAGASMGGLIVRYALAFMEQNNCNHCSKMTISFDTPHKGANIPLGIQHLTKHYSISDASSWFRYNMVLSSPAVMQMAYQHTNSSAGAIRSAWVSEYANLGYPKKTLNTAIINGRANGTGYGFGAGAILLQYLYGSTSNIYVWGMPNNPTPPSSQLLFSSKTPKTGKRILGGKRTAWNVVLSYFPTFGQTNSWFYNTYSDRAPTPSLPYDNAPGSASDYIETARKAVEKEVGNLGTLTIPQGKFSSFVNTVSSMDVNTTNLNMDFSLDANLALSPLFDPFKQFSSNEAHIQITTGNINWLKNRVDLVEQQLTSTLPNASGNTYNFGEVGRNRIPTIAINNLGVLQINGYYNTAYGSGPPTVIASTFEVVTESCDPTITINSGGKIIVGDVSATPDNIGILTLRKGSTLIIENGGTLEVQNGSKLIVEYGAKLVYKPGAIIKLVGADALLEIKGEVEIQAGANFSFSSDPGITNGFIRFDYTGHLGHQPITVTGTTASIGLSGANIQGLYQDKVLEVIGGELTTPDNSLGATAYLNSFTIYNGMVNLKSGAKLSPTVTSTFTYTYFNGEGKTSTEQGLYITKPTLTTINHCSFNSLYRGISFYMNSMPSAFAISYSSFYNNGIGIYSTDGGGLDITNSSFSNNTIGIQANLLTQNCKFQESSFSDNGSPSTAIGVQLTSTSTINSYFYHSSFTGTEIGINTLTASPSLNNVSVTLKCTKFKNNKVGVQAGHDLNLSTTKTLGGYSGGDNVFYFNSSAPSNSVALYPTYSLYLGSSQNSFIDVNSPTTTNTFIVGEARVCTPTICDFYNTTSSLKGSGSYWNPAPSANNLNNGNGSLYILNKIGGGTLLLDGPITTSFASSCFNIPSGTEPQFVSSGTGPFNKTGDTEIEQEEISNPVKLSIYPNPAKDRIYIQTPLKEQKTYIVQLFDLVGRKVYENTVTSSEYSKLEIPTTTLANGNYLLTIKTTDGSLFESQRVVILNQ